MTNQILEKNTGHTTRKKNQQTKNHLVSGKQLTFFLFSFMYLYHYRRQCNKEKKGSHTRYTYI